MRRIAPDASARRDAKCYADKPGASPGCRYEKAAARSIRKRQRNNRCSVASWQKEREEAPCRAVTSDAAARSETAPTRTGDSDRCRGAAAARSSAPGARRCRGATRHAEAGKATLLCNPRGGSEARQAERCSAERRGRTKCGNARRVQRQSAQPATPRRYARAQQWRHLRRAHTPRAQCARGKCAGVRGAKRTARREVAKVFTKAPPRKRCVVERLPFPRPPASPRRLFVSALPREVRRSSVPRCHHQSPDEGVCACAKKMTAHVLLRVVAAPPKRRTMPGIEEHDLHRNQKAQREQRDCPEPEPV